MYSRWRDYADLPQILLGILLCIFLTVLWTAIMTQVSPGLAARVGNANRTKTAIALTSNALLDPFPTHTCLIWKNKIPAEYGYVQPHANPFLDSDPNALCIRNGDTLHGTAH
jgi:hypothetical protein